MTSLIIIAAASVTLFLNIVFVRQISDKTSKIFMCVANIILSLAFVILLVVMGTVKNNLESYIDSGIARLEKQADAIYPGILDKKLKTEEIKEILENSQKIKEVDGIEALAENILKSQVKKYTSITLTAINMIERDDNRLSIKDALLSIKELSVKSVTPFFRILTVVFSVLYFLLVLVSVFLSSHLAKDKGENGSGIVFGEEADKTFIGMEIK